MTVLGDMTSDSLSNASLVSAGAPMLHLIRRRIQKADALHVT